MIYSVSKIFSCSHQVPLVAVDSFFYGKVVIAPLNILLYNVFTPHGPDLYGKLQNVLFLKKYFFDWKKKIQSVNSNH